MHPGNPVFPLKARIARSSGKYPNALRSFSDIGNRGPVTSRSIDVISFLAPVGGDALPARGEFDQF